MRDRFQPFHGLYWLFPLIAFVVWWGTLLGLLLWWAVADNAKQYQPGQPTILVSPGVFSYPAAEADSCSTRQYVSNVGAEPRKQALFIAGVSTTAVFYTLSLLMERWLRHLRRIPGPLRKRDRNADIVACIFGILGSIALVLLSCLNDLAFPNAHWSMAAVFIVCIAISALCQTLEIMWLKQDHIDRKHLRRNAIIKWIIVVLAICCAICFGATYGVCAGSGSRRPLTSRCDRIKSVAAIFEWTIAGLYGVYLGTMGFDLWPAHKTRNHLGMSKDFLIEGDRNNTLHVHKNPAMPGARGGVLEEVENGTARPSLASDGQYGRYAEPVVQSNGLAQPEMAHTGHGQVHRTVY
ncbi:hypothetical protein NBRC10513_005926 [Rhodotorula toruloides]|uniref:BY PROTMAP: gi/472584211/gb/EMS21817.1/ FK506 suppressor Sfk1 [Rhodosporidium toruloides NP11] gi/647394463/emb/CDR35693.1/ RHTO0S01e05028g1_1 [Rhodosporidium toruloides] n=1 Tax=Rhodotorula toruloides TaxID=5286 RepID=A0A0K3CKH2_RHOTO